MTSMDAHPVVASWRQYTQWLGEHVPLAAENLAPGATDEQLAEVATVVGHELPADVQALLRVNNGQSNPFLATSGDGGVPAFPETNLLSTQSIIEEWQRWRDGLDDEEWQEVGSTLAPDAVKPYYSYPHWVPLLSAAARADFFGADFDPEPAGTSGQIINFGRDEECHYVAAPDLTTLIGLIVEKVTAGPDPSDKRALDDGAWEGYRHAFVIVYYHHFPLGHPEHEALDYEDWRPISSKP